MIKSYLNFVIRYFLSNLRFFKLKVKKLIYPLFKKGLKCSILEWHSKVSAINHSINTFWGLYDYNENHNILFL